MPDNDRYLLEVREEVLPTPARIPKVLPSVVVTSGAAVKEHAIDDSPTTNYCAGVQRSSAVVQPRLRSARVDALVLGGYWQTRGRGTILSAVSVDCLAAPLQNCRRSCAYTKPYSITRTLTKFCQSCSNTSGACR